MSLVRNRSGRLAPSRCPSRQNCGAIGKKAATQFARAEFEEEWREPSGPLRARKLKVLFPLIPLDTLRALELTLLASPRCGTVVVVVSRGADSGGLMFHSILALSVLWFDCQVGGVGYDVSWRLHVTSSN